MDWDSPRGAAHIKLYQAKKDAVKRHIKMIRARLRESVHRESRTTDDSDSDSDSDSDTDNALTDLYSEEDDDADDATLEPLDDYDSDHAARAEATWLGV